MDIVEKEKKLHEETVTTGYTLQYHLAGISSRLLAYLIDMVVILALSYLIFSRILPFPEIGNLSWIAPSLLSVGLVGVIYFILLTRFFNQTIGKIIIGIRVIRLDGEPLDWKAVLFRELVGRLVSQLGGLHIGYVWALFHPNSQSWHDIIGETIVVYTKDAADRRLVKILRNN